MNDTMLGTIFSLFSSPKQERVNEEVKPTTTKTTINSFLNDYFNKHLLETTSLNLYEFLATELAVLPYSSIPRYSFPEVILWLSRNIETKLDKTLGRTKPDTGLEGFLPIQILDLSNLTLTLEDVQILSNCLRHNTTINEVRLDNCGIDDKAVKVLAYMFRSNNTITKLTLDRNNPNISDGITNIGIKTLLQIKEYNETLKNVRVRLYCEDDSSYQIVNIFDRNKEQETLVIANSNLTKTGLLVTNAKSNLESIAENYNEITGKGKTDNLIIVVGLNGSGRSVVSYGMSGEVNLIANNKLQVEKDDATLNLDIQHAKPDTKIAEEVNKRKVNNFKTSDENTKIIEFPGSLTKNVSDDQQDINIFSDAYSWWQISELGESIRFLIILKGYSRDSFVSTIKQFIEIFKNEAGKVIFDLSRSVSLVFIDNFGDEVTKGQRIDNIKETLKRHTESKANNVFKKDDELKILNALVENTIFINYPQKEGNFTEVPNFNDLKTTGIKIKDICVHYRKIAPHKIALTPEICTQVYENFRIITTIIESFFEFNKVGYLILLILFTY